MHAIKYLVNTARASHAYPHNARYIRIFILICGLFFYQESCAQDLNKSASISFDKESIPMLWDLWPDAPGVALPYTSLVPEAAIALVCASNSDTTNGACHTHIGGAETHSYYSPLPPDFGEKIRLKMTSSRGETRDIILYGYYGNACSWVPMYAYQPCAGDNPLGFKLRTTQEMLGLLPAGEWNGLLKIYALNSWTNRTATVTVNLNINITDHREQEIYFPAFPSSSPVINLNLNNLPGVTPATKVSGQNSIDMCLYDGSNSTSKSISLTFQDEGATAPDRAGGQFSVYRDGSDKSQVANRIDYSVTVINPTNGAPQPVNNGKEIIWTNTNARNILRQVVLPGVPGTSFCVPAPITLTTPEFTLANKNSGHYSGHLKVIYTPSTQYNN